jgi:formate/nitrite transporter FocA (FNT family)
MWLITWLGNFVGCALSVGLMLASGIYEGKEWYTVLLAHKKVTA